MKKKIILALLSFLLVFTPYASADTVSDNALRFLRSKQEASGKITTGFSAPSQWSAIAFSLSGIDISTVKNAEASLKDFLLRDVPQNESGATEWETRILAIVAIGDDPANFGGVNYIEKLQAYYTDNQLGDTCSMNDDILGLLALTSAGERADRTLKESILHFIIANQDADGGFGFSKKGCPWYATSADMTAAAVQALQIARENNLQDPKLSEAIAQAKAYLLANQHADGGFGYFGTSDVDTTGWVLMALSTIGESKSEHAERARAWLLSQQSAADGGFQAFDYGANAFVSNATTTAQAIIALSQKGWVPKVFVVDQSASISATGIPSVTLLPSPTTVVPTVTPVLLTSLPVTPTLTSAPTAILSPRRMVNTTLNLGETTTYLPDEVEKSVLSLQSKEIEAVSFKKRLFTPIPTVVTRKPSILNVNFLPFLFLAGGIMSLFFAVTRKRYG